MFNWVEYLRGAFLYLLPIIIFIVSLAVYQNALLIAIAITWIFFSFTYKIILLPDDSNQVKRNTN